MENLKRFFITLAVISLPMFFFHSPVRAQTLDDSWDSEVDTYESTTTYDTFDFDTTLDDVQSIQNTEDAEALLGFFALFTGGILIFAIIMSLGMYVYTCLTLQKTAQKLGMENTWFAWLPILNTVLLFRMGEQNPLYILLGLIPGIGAVILLVFSIIATMNVCEKRGYDKALALLTLIPIASLVLWGILAWGKTESTTPFVAPVETPDTPA